MASYGRKIDGLLGLDISPFSKGIGTAKDVLSGFGKDVKNVNSAIGNLGGNSLLNRLRGELKSVGVDLTGTSKTGTDSFNSLYSKFRGIVSGMVSTASSGGQAIGRGIANVNNTVFNPLYNKFKGAVNGMVSAASSGAKSIVDSFSGIEGAIGGLVSGFGLLQMVETGWLGSTQAQMNEALLSKKFGINTAKSTVAAIQDIVAKVPGDDTFMNSFLSSVARVGGTTNVNQLTTVAQGASDYMNASLAAGKMGYEIQQDLTKYILYGNTAELERGSILSSQIDKLKGKNSIEERSLAMNEAMKTLGLDGLSTLDVAANKWEEIKGYVQKTLTQIGTFLLPYAQAAMKAFITLDDITGGWSTGIMVVGAGIIALVGFGAMLISTLAPVGALLLPIMNFALIGPLFSASAISMTGGLQMIAGGFISLEVAGAPVWAIILAVVALGVAIYGVGVYLGWWNDLAGMGAAIMARLADAWNGLVYIGQQLWIILTPIGNALNYIGQIISGFLYQQWLLLLDAIDQVSYAVQPLGNLFNQLFSGDFSGAISSIQATMTNLGRMILEWIFFGVSGAGGLSTIIGALFGDTATRQIFNAFYMTIKGITYAFQDFFNAIDTGKGVVGIFTSAISALPTLFAQIGLSILNWFLTIDWIGMFSHLVDGVSSAIDNVINMISNFDMGSLFGDSAGKGGDTAGKKIVDGVSKQVTPSRFQQIFQRVTDKLSEIDWSKVLTTFGGLMLKLAIVVGTAGFRIGIALLTKLGQGIWIGLASIDWGGIALSVVNWLLDSFARYNPLTMLVTILFGQDAGNMVTDAIKNAFSSIGSFASLVFDTLFGGSDGQDLGDNINNWFASIDWIGIVNNVLNTVFTLIGHYNPVTLLTALIFGPEAAQGVQDTTVQFLWGLVNTFITGLTLLYDGIVFVATLIYDYFSWLWNGMLWIATTSWNLIYSTAMAIWNPIYTFFIGIWNGIYSVASWVWNNVFLVIYDNLHRVWTDAVNIGTQIWSALTGVFHRIYDTVRPIFDGIRNGFNWVRDGLVNAANTIRDNVWGPIKTLWDHLTGFWNWITHPLSGGSSGGQAGTNSAGPRPAAGPRPGVSSNRSNYAGGLFSGIMDTAFNNTEYLTGHRPVGRYAGPRSFSSDLGDGDYPPECSLENPCYAGSDFDFSKTWKDELLKTVNGWHMNLNGQSFELKSLSQNGSLALFNSIATKLISPTRYDYYYNGRYSDREALQRKAFNCFDGAEIMIDLARSMNLPARMGHTMWGNDGHAYAVVANSIFDTTAMQKYRSWRAPGINYSGPGHSTKSETKKVVQFKISGNTFIGMEDFKAMMKDVAEEVFYDETDVEFSIGS